jgi:hypothetical protein
MAIGPLVIVTLVALAACSGGGAHPNALPYSTNSLAQQSAIPSSTGVPTIFVANASVPGTVEQFAANANGDVRPLQTLTLAQTTQFVASHDGYVYVTTNSFTSPSPTGQIAIFAPGGTTPQNVISGNATGLIRPLGIAVDPSGYIYAIVQDASGIGGTVEVFSPLANGNVPPVRVIQGPHTLLSTAQPAFVALDSLNNIYVSGVHDALLVFSAVAQGDAPPIAIISNPNGGAAPAGSPAGIAVDALSGDIYVVAYGAPNMPSPAIAVFSPLGCGLPHVISYINASPIFGLEQGAWGPVGIALTSNSIFVGDILNTSIDVLDKGSSGDVTPVRVIQGPDTRLDNPQGIAVSQ